MSVRCSPWFFSRNFYSHHLLSALFLSSDARAYSREETQCRSYDRSDGRGGEWPVKVSSTTSFVANEWCTRSLLPPAILSFLSHSFFFLEPLSLRFSKASLARKKLPMLSLLLTKERNLSPSSKKRRCFRLPVTAMATLSLCCFCTSFRQDQVWQKWVERPLFYFSFTSLLSLRCPPFDRRPTCTYLRFDLILSHIWLVMERSGAGKLLGTE